MIDIWAGAWQNQQIDLYALEDSEQPGYLSGTDKDGIWW